mgnify:CR=1 FL=1
MKVEEIRSLLAQAGYSKEVIDGLKGKAALETALAQVNGDFSVASSDTTPAQTVDDLPKAEPELGSPEWTEYCLGLLRPTHLMNGSPTCAGLRWLTQHLLGDIIYSKPTHIFPSVDPEGIGRATVGFEVGILWKMGMYAVLDVGSIIDLSESILVRNFADVADCWSGNTPLPYANHPSSTACTRAEARCYRKALQLNILSAEELTNNTTKDSDMSGDFNSDNISDTQKVFVEFKCRQLGIDMNKFIATNTDKPLNQIDRVKAIELIKVLNSYQYSDENKDARVIPEEIKI